MVQGEFIEQFTDALRREPYSLLTNDCITKSARLKRIYRSNGVAAKVVICIGMARARWFGRRLTIPVIHGWTEVEGRRIETSRPLGTSGIWDIVPVNVRPVIKVKF